MSDMNDRVEVEAVKQHCFVDLQATIASIAEDKKINDQSGPYYRRASRRQKFRR